MESPPLGGSGYFGSCDSLSELLIVCGGFSKYSVLGDCRWTRLRSALHDRSLVFCEMFSEQDDIQRPSRLNCWWACRKDGSVVMRLACLKNEIQ
jgi:hypothetical protein